MKSLIVSLIVCLAAFWIQDVKTIKPTDEPSMTALQDFETKNGDRVDILEQIGADYHKFGICLLNDKVGNKVTAIAKSNQFKVEPILIDIFEKWRKGTDCTWASIVVCLRTSGLNRLASIIEETYNDSTDGGIQGKNVTSKLRNNYGMNICNTNFSSGELDINLICKEGTTLLECVTENEKKARGLGIIITNDYIDSRQKSLRGTCKDGRSLLKTLVHSDFIVLWLHNVDQRVISDVMKEVKNLEQHSSGQALIKKYECILFAFSGHGLNNKYIVMQNNIHVDVESEVLKPLLPSSIPKFGEVPKILLIDACRGDLATETVSTKKLAASDVITKDTIPAEGNYLLACATMPQHVSYMYAHGSAWMQEFASLARHSRDSVEGVLVSVNEHLTKQANKGIIEFQQPDMYVRLSKKVHIFREKHDRTEL